MTSIITDPDALSALCQRIRNAPRIAIDTEFHNERSYTARLMVVQIAFEDEIVLIDPIALPNLTPLAEALQHTTVVGHALSGDLRIFAERFGVLPSRIFDTQIAAAFCGYGLSISLLDLVQSITGIRLQKSQTVSDWSARPLTQRQLEYLVDDVAHLFALHDALQKKLEANQRLAWADAEMDALSQLSTFTADPQRLYLRLNGTSRLNRRDLGIVRELAALRDRIARDKDVPSKYIFSDDVLMSIMSVRPSQIEELSQLRRLEPSARKAYGAEIVAAIQRASDLPEYELPPRITRMVPLNRDGIVTLLSVVAAAIAAEHDLPTALLAPRAALDRVARDLPKDHEEMSVALELSEWRVALLADRLLDLLAGRTALCITDTKNETPRVVTVSQFPL